MRRLASNGPLLMLFASLNFALMGAGVKYVSPVIPLSEIVFFRSVVALGMAGIAGWSVRRQLAGVNRRMLLTRGLVGMASMFAYFYAIAQLKLGDAVLLTYLSPLIVAALSPFVLREKAPPVIWFALALGFAGVWVVADPGGAELPGLGVAAGLASAFLAASAYVSVKFLSRTDGTATIVFWFSALSAVVSGALCLFGWKTPNGMELAVLLGVGLTAGAAQISMTRAYAVGNAAEISVFGYATPVLAYALGHLLLREHPGWRGAAGTSLLVLAGLCASVLSRPGRVPPGAPIPEGPSPPTNPAPDRGR